ncbi:hypothetical protein BD626DRAFT_39331 [Schizophyllum amplum]|uniref:Uncharacterized protein n=1 Tax=Schizophyllum amplum TaxID=97359 RepID=A0A550BSZ4_9AGAR|nr:hypothetical protein BD626DRAFT_39331 [Auriculariopsis ampla]
MHPAYPSGWQRPTPPSNILPVRLATSYPSVQHPTRPAGNILPVRLATSYPSGWQHPTPPANILPLRPTSLPFVRPARQAALNPPANARASRTPRPPNGTEPSRQAALNPVHRLSSLSTLHAHRLHIDFARPHRLPIHIQPAYSCSAAPHLHPLRTCPSAPHLPVRLFSVLASERCSRSRETRRARVPPRQACSCPPTPGVLVSPHARHARVPPRQAHPTLVDKACGTTLPTRRPCLRGGARSVDAALLPLS